MKRLTLALLVLLVGGGLAATLIGSGTPGKRDSAPPGNLPNGQIELLAAYPFVLDEPFEHEWRAEKPLVRAGYLLVLQADPDLARPRDAYEPVLYVGEDTAERCNTPWESGRIVALAPSSELADGRVALDLDTAPIWFGSLELPERVDAARVQDELANARRSGIGPARRSPSLALQTAARDVIHARTRDELVPYVEDLVERFSAR